MKPATIRNLEDLVETLEFETVEDLTNHLNEEIYPVALDSEEGKITLMTDADRVPFTKELRFPFEEKDFENALVGLQCVTDYAMHEGYWHTHKDLFETLALRYAEKHGVYEYTVNKEYMEYWSLYDEGFYFYRIDLNTSEREEVCHLPWSKADGYPVPAFLKTEVEGYTKYNYFEG